MCWGRRYMTSEGCAFFDVDETLIAVQSMFSFLRYHLACAGKPGTYEEVTDRLRTQAASGASRIDVLREYYRCYAGIKVADIVGQGAEWFEKARRASGFFLPASLAAFGEHRRRGDFTVLLSGSFSACLDPIAAWLGADLVCGTHLRTAGGIYTGDVETMMIGPRKAEATGAVMAARSLSPSVCHAYGDHSSDLPMLLTVGHPVVVGSDPVLTRHAIAGNWPRLPGAC